MKRSAEIVCAVVCLLLLPATALAAAHHRSPRRRHTATAADLPQQQASGTVLAVNGSTFTVQERGQQMTVVQALTAAADDVTAGDFPYVYGGGHPEAGVASVGIKGPGYNGRRIGFDCSGSVAAVLADAGVWPAASGVPNDAGVIAQLRSEKLIARGLGTGTQQVTFYDDPGVHIFMNIDGRFFGTSDGGGGNATQLNGGAGWLDDSAWDATDHAFKRYHLLPSVLTQPTTFHPLLTFRMAAGSGIRSELEVGAALSVSYTQSTTGALTAQSVAGAGA